MSEPLHVFLHIPKTSGTTIREFVKPHFSDTESLYWYGGENCKMSSEELASRVGARTRLLFGHCHFGVHQYLERPVQYHTVLRNPLERLISFYEFTRTRNAETVDIPGVVKYAQEHSIVDFFLRFPEVCNEQCRYLSPQEPDNVERAVANLRSMHFGLQDCTTLFITEVAQQLSIPVVAFKNRKVLKKKKKVSADHLEKIKKTCAADLDLFEQAKQIFTEQHSAPLSSLRLKSRFLEKKAGISYFLHRSN